MKTRLLFLMSIFAGVAMFVSCSKTQDYEIDGKINIGSGTIYLKSFRNKMFFVTDSSEIKNGTFRFTGKVERPDLFGLSIDRNELFHPYFIFVENSKIFVSIDTANTRSAEITGSASNDLFNSFQSKRAGTDIDSFIQANPASPVAAYILYREYATRFSAGELEKSLALFDSSLNNLVYIQELKTIIETKKRVETGNPAPDFTGITPGGKELKLSDFRGKYVLLDFWASWCGPCRRENPNLVKAYKQFHQKGLEIFAVSLDEKREDWLKAIEKDSLAWPHVSDLKFWDSEPAGIYGIRNIPSNVLINPEGIIIARNLRGEELIARLDEIF